MTRASLFLAFVAPFLLAVAFSPALRLNRPVRWASLVGVCALITLTPFALPADASGARFAAAWIACILSIKLYEVIVGVDHGRVPDFRAFLLFLPNLVRFLLDGRRSRESRSALPVKRDVVAGTLGTIMGSSIWCGSGGRTGVGYPFGSNTPRRGFGLPKGTALLMRGSVAPGGSEYPLLRGHHQSRSLNFRRDGMGFDSEGVEPHSTQWMALHPPEPVGQLPSCPIQSGKFHPGHDLATRPFFGRQSLQ